MSSSKKGGVPLSDAQKVALGMDKEEVIDYTKIRNDRVIPFVHLFFADLGSHPIDQSLGSQAVDEALNDFYSNKFIMSAMVKDLKLNDINYFFQIARRAVEMAMERSVNTNEDTRLVPIAQEILLALSSEETLMLDILEQDPNVSEKRAALYDKIYKEKVCPIMEKHNVQYNEIQTIFNIALALVSLVENKTKITLDSARKLAESKLWNVEDVDEVSIKQVHEKCIEPVDSTTKETKDVV